MTFITVDILGGSIGILFSLFLGIVVTYVSILRASSNLRRKLIIKTALLAWLGVIALLIIPLWLSFNKILPEWAYWASVATFLAVFVPCISNYYKKRILSLNILSG